MKAEALPQGWSAQWAELWALAQALRHAEGKRVNIYTDPRYTFATLHVHGAIFFMKEKKGWGKLPDQRHLVRSNIAIQLVKQHFETTHLGKTALESLLSCYYFIPKFPTLCAQISARCVTCLQNNASQRPRPNPGVQTVGILPFEDL